MTTEQLTLPIGPLTEVDGRDLTIQQRFDLFNTANPWVYDALEVLTADWLAAGHKRVGIKMLIERIRWEYGRRTVGEVFRLDNSFTSRYARLLVERHPDWATVFETRTLRAE